MPYGLGIDLGTGCTVAAITRTPGGSAGSEVVPLGVNAPGIPTVLHLADDGTVLIGPAAEPLVLSDPDRVFRSFLHQVDEPSEPSPASLIARLVRWVVDAVADREGSPPERITLAHPAAWGAGECRAVHAALHEVGLPGVMLVPVPVAVATSGAAQCNVADLVAVYDLGATFCAAVARREGTGFVLLGEPQMIEDGGGARFDELVLARVLDELGDQIGAPDLDDHVVLAGMAALLVDCVAAREALCDRPEVAIPVSLPGLQAEVRLTRDELETLIAPTLRATVAALRAAISAAALTPRDVGTVLITGGCARIPHLTRMLTAELGRPVVLLADPDLAAARGAAYLAAHTDAAHTSTAAPVAAQLPRPAPGAAQPARTAPAAAQPSQADLDEPIEQLPAVREFAETPASPFPEYRSSAGSRARPRPRVLLAVAAGLLAVALVALPLTLLRAPDMGTEASTINQGDPGREDRAPLHGSTGASLAPPDATDSGPATVPTALPLPPVVRRIAAALEPQSPLPPAPRPPAGTADPITDNTSPAPGPTTTQPPPTTTSPPPPTSTTPPPTSTTPPPTSTQPPPTTTPPPPTTTTPPPTTTTPPTPTSTSTTPPQPTSTTTAPPEPNP